MKFQNLKAVRHAVSAIEEALIGYRTENYVGANQAAQMAFRTVVQTLLKNGWLPHDDAEVLIQEQESQWLKQWNYTPLGDGTAQNVDVNNGFEEFS